ncbi:MAG: peptidyl-tRNA hydrolase, partial [Chloroflexi bacterium]|nr:peptidyl-tRNA hydrolase [Chloroflexota bacterium]
DDLDLPLGRIRIRSKGSAGGHRGMESIIRVTGSTDFPRIRVGIGRPGVEGRERESEEVVGYVLSRFTADEEKVMELAVARVDKALDMILLDGVLAAMNEFNRAGDRKSGSDVDGADPDLGRREETG